MKRVVVLVCVLACCCVPMRARGDAGDGFDSPIAQAVRSATQRYRLVVWAQHDGYVQTTDYIASFGTMYTDHERFDPPSFAAPTVLVYDLAGRLVACGYQFLDRSKIFDALTAPEVRGWYDIPKHVHYNIVVAGKNYYAQQPWPTDESPTAAALVARKLMPADATLTFAFVHPAARAIIVWAWSPNPSGLFAADDPSLP